MAAAFYQRGNNSIFHWAIMPQPWLAYLVDRAAPGTSAGILITYLFRLLMAAYAFIGLQCFIFSFDIKRYRLLIWLLGIGGLIAAFIGLIVLFFTVPAVNRTGIFWIVFCDFCRRSCPVSPGRNSSFAHPST